MSPLLFVICTEYLFRILHYVGDQKEYKYHYRCQSLRLNHLVFADDLILFCRGDKQSVMLNMRALATFTQSSGLVANNGKSALYACNMNKDDKNEIISRTGFIEDWLPFKYLGVRINARKLNSADCDFMVDKIVARIKSWGSRHLSYAGRVQLVNVVLLNLYSYWASIFFSPKKIIYQVIAICRISFCQVMPSPIKPLLLPGIWFGDRKKKVGWDSKRVMPGIWPC